MSQDYKFNVTKEEYEKTVQRWIELATERTTLLGCGFCDARTRQVETDVPYQPNTLFTGCEHCELYPEHCGTLNTTVYNTFDKFVLSRGETKRQAALEMLEALYNYGVKHGYIVYEDGDECPHCKQTVYHSGEYPCPVCDRPQTWDE
jgi:hypothetical protein